MRAVLIADHGGPDSVDRLVFAERPRPPVGDGQVLVRVGAVGVCGRDLVDRAGRNPYRLPEVVTGHEFAGEIVEIGAGVAGFAVGDRVVNLHRPPCGRCAACRAGEDARCTGSPLMFGLTVDGGYAEYVLAHAAALVHLPAPLSFDEGCFLHCTAAVALRALRTRARLAPGETVVMSGASGGVGVHALQVAKRLGARVVAVTSSPSKVERLRELGADEVVVGGRPGWYREVQARTDGGADVALELVGAPTFNDTLRSLRLGGRLALLGNVTGERVDVNPGYLILREASVIGSSSANRRDLEEILEWAGRGELRPIVADRLPLERAREAQQRLADKSVVGRIVLRPSS